MKVLVLVLALMTAVVLGQNQIKAFGETFNLIPPEDTMKVNGTDFTIPYSTTGGKITSIQVDTDAKTIVAQIQSSTNGSMTIILPRVFIDAYQGNAESHFVVFKNSHGVHYTELENTENRTLTIPFNPGDSTIEIKGTHMVPEFGAVVSIILTISVIAMIVVYNGRKS
ncbi:MAG: hypothetical protein KGI27_11360 [Thaumarchaeota archaeon]|nr:hypothetical protein [Nitrososphaerota archaeon]